MSSITALLIRPEKIMHIDELLKLPEAEQLSDTTWQTSALTIPKTWAQGRTAYGGISAGMIYSAMSPLAPKDAFLRAYTTNFIGPIELTTPFQIVIEILRQGKNVTQMLGKIMQNERVCVLCQGVFGQNRSSKIRVDNQDTHDMEIPKKPNFIPQIPKVTPKFLRYYDLNIDNGGIPFTNKDSSHYHGWMRYSEPPSEFTLAHLISIIDAWPPTLLQMMRWPAPASTVSWHIDFLHPLPAIKPSDWLAYQSDTRQANDGYGHTEAIIWDQNKQVIALSRQTVAVFD